MPFGTGSGRSNGSGLSEIAELSTLTVGGSFSDISADTYAAGDWVQIQLAEESDGRDIVSIGPIKFADISDVYLQKENLEGAPVEEIAETTNLPDEGEIPTTRMSALAGTRPIF